MKTCIVVAVVLFALSSATETFAAKKVAKGDDKYAETSPYEAVVDVEKGAGRDPVHAETYNLYLIFNNLAIGQAAEVDSLEFRDLAAVAEMK